MPNLVKLTEDSFSELVQSAVSALQEGSLIALPTDTLYGLAALAQKSEAIHEIYRVKKRNPLKPLAVCVAHVADIYHWAKVTVPEKLLLELLPGPVTLVFQRTSILNVDLNPDTDLIGIRIPDSKFIREISIACGAPLALTSANISNQKSPLAVEEFQDIWSNVAVVYDGGIIGKQINLAASSSIVQLEQEIDLSRPNKSVTQDSSKITSFETCVREGSTVVNLSIEGHYSVLRDGIALENTLSILQKFGLKSLN
ncbi:hypothetical protein HAZT_HAZT005060 [Hyalella azteca]|nr:hypothetical protein HAZT_HAZT005060 [Hyalella azteca]